MVAALRTSSLAGSTDSETSMTVRAARSPSNTSSASVSTSASARRRMNGLSPRTHTRSVSSSTGRSPPGPVEVAPQVDLHGLEAEAAEVDHLLPDAGHAVLGALVVVGVRDDHRPGGAPKQLPHPIRSVAEA
jgi:hypothetical protein